VRMRSYMGHTHKKKPLLHRTGNLCGGDRESRCSGEQRWITQWEGKEWKEIVSEAPKGGKGGRNKERRGTRSLEMEEPRERKAKEGTTRKPFEQKHQPKS